VRKKQTTKKGKTILTTGRGGILDQWFQGRMGRFKVKEQGVLIVRERSYKGRDHEPR